MKKLIIIICAAIFILCSTLCVMAENETFTVTLTYLDQDSNSLKDADIYEYELGADVAIPLDSLSIEGYEITSIPEVTVVDENITISNLEKDEVVTINYLKLNTYKVCYLSDDNLIKEEIRYGKVNETIPKDVDLEEIFGYKLKGHDEAVVLDDDSASVNIYYTEDSFFTYFDLNGGTSGPSALFQKYGSKIENIEDPYKEGYDFIGWFKERECLTKVDINNLYVTGEFTYFAGYLKSDEEALVTIVFYGENANDDRYSYLGKIEKKLVIGDTYTYNPENEEEHYYHSHNLSCFGVSNLEPVTVNETEFKGFYLLNENLEDGYVYYRLDNKLGKDNEYYYLRYNGNFYRTDKEHISYQVGETRRLKDYIVEDEFRLFKPSTRCNGSYEFEKSDTITVHKTDSLVYVYLKRNRYTLSFGDSSTYPNNKYGVIEAKWGQMIYDDFAEISKFDDDNFGWIEINDKNAGTVKFLLTMPNEDRNYYRSSKYDGTVRLNYYLKINGSYQKIYTTYWTYGTHTSDADYSPIDGYVLNTEKSIHKGTKLKTGKDVNNIYYDPIEYDLVLVSYVDESVIFKIPYRSTLESADSYIPAARYDYQSFEGWYLDQDCKGERIDLKTKQMPDFNLTLFAKWNRTNLSVRFVDDKSSINQEVNVLYGDLVNEIPTITNPNFVGWVKDGSNYIIDFNNYVITKNETFYALYDDDQFVNYTINYLTHDLIKVAEPTHGSIITGNKIYVSPKISSSLNEPYKNEFKPENTNYVLTVDENNKEFDIYYIPYFKYNLTITPIGLENNDSLIAIINGKGFNNLEISLNKTRTIKGFYEGENYIISFDNGYSKTYADIDPKYLKMNDNKTLEVSANKLIRDFYNQESHIENIFYKYE